MKSILKSKTFWFNIATGAATYAGYLPMPYAGYVSAIGNILLRLLTTVPVTVLPQ